jgi:hypothetical protein
MPNVNVNTSASGNTTLVAAAAGKIVRVMGYAFNAAGTVNVKLTDGSTDAMGPLAMAVNNTVESGFNPNGWYDTAVGNALSINLSANIQVSGHVSYVVLG